MSFVKYDVFQAAENDTWRLVGSEVEGHNAEHALRAFRKSGYGTKGAPHFMLAPTRNIAYLDGRVERVEQLTITEMKRPVVQTALGAEGTE